MKSFCNEGISLNEEEVFIFPVSYAQQRLWFLEQLVPSNPFYNVSTTVRLIGPLNVAALQQTFNEIVRRHEALRTTFRLVDAQPVQAIAPSLNVALPVIDLQILPATERSQRVQWLTTQEAQRPFNLAQGPLLRMQLLHLDAVEYVLLLTMHHIVSDGWSIGVLIHELKVLYAAFATGQPSPLAELPIQYADFAQWQRQWLQGEVFSTQLAYWQQQLKDLSVLQLPTDRPRPAVQSYQGATQYLELPLNLSQALESLGQRAEVTLFITLLAAFQTLLYRYTGQTDIAVGSPIANRNRSEIEDLIGFFVNSLVLRTGLDGNPTFLELLERVREVALGAYAHQDLPFERLVEALQPERDLSYTPLFQVMFALQSAPTPTLDLVGLNLNFSEVESRTAKFDLTLSMENTEQGLKGSLEYSTDLFDAATITTMLEHFQTLLAGIVAQPEQHLSNLPLLSEAERYQLLVEWNDTQAEYPQHCIHQLFEAQVERTPDTIAIWDIEQLTYQELNSRSNQLAHYLQALGVGPDVLVGICVKRSWQMVVGMLAILKAGAAYLPLDPAYPAERLAFMLEDAQVKVLLTQQPVATGRWGDGAMGGTQIKSICMDCDCETIAQQSENNPVSGAIANNLAYAIYTSGSTGKPKGVLIEHGSLLNLVFWHQRQFEVTPSDRATAIAGVAFDACGWELWPYLTAGASIYFCNDETRTSPPRLQGWLLQQEITVSFVPTPLAEALLGLDWPRDTALRILLTGGDKLQQSPPSLPFTLVNNYGPTEHTVVATSGVVSWERGKWGDGEMGKSLPIQNCQIPTIGRPIANTQVYLLDSQLQPVPIGAKGELYISGDGLARGYLNQPDLTAERFIPHPYSSQRGARLYKTGDLARHRPDGTIQFLGRIDEQVKIRGYRIELEEIEAVLTQHPAVQQTTVIVREDVPGDKRLVAYVVLHADQLIKQEKRSPPSDFRHFLKQKLPNYLIPSTFVVLEALPLTPNGKVNRRVLPTPDPYSSRQEKADAAPRTAVEEILVKIWAELLGLQVDVNDNFFELGGHSLLATQLISRMRDAFQVDLPLHVLFKSPTVADIAAYIETVIWAANDQQINTSSDREEVEF